MYPAGSTIESVHRYLTTGGLLLSGIALLGLAWLSATSSPMEIALKLALLGAGQSIFLIAQQRLGFIQGK